MFQNVITIQQLMDQMSAQVMNTQLQLQQSLQQLIAMGTHTNQSDGPMSTANQNQVILSANQQQRSVPVNCEGENTQIIPLYSMTFQPKDAADQDNIHVSQCIIQYGGRGYKFKRFSDQTLSAALSFRED